MSYFQAFGRRMKEFCVGDFTDNKHSPFQKSMEWPVHFCGALILISWLLKLAHSVCDYVRALLILRHREVFPVRTFNYYAEPRWSNPIDAHQSTWIIVLSPHLWCEWQCERARFLRGCSNFPQHFEQCQEAPRRAGGKGTVGARCTFLNSKRKRKKIIKV